MHAYLQVFIYVPYPYNAKTKKYCLLFKNKNFTINIKNSLYFANICITFSKINKLNPNKLSFIRLLEKTGTNQIKFTYFFVLRTQKEVFDLLTVLHNMRAASSYFSAVSGVLCVMMELVQRKLQLLVVNLDTGKLLA